MEPLGILSLDRKKYTQAMAENLPALRARLGLSQTQLADRIGDLIERRILRQLALDGIHADFGAIGMFAGDIFHGAGV